MISRRLIRIKVLQVFYAYAQKSGTTLSQAEKELDVSLKRSLYLYYSLLLLIYNMVDYAGSRIEIARAKKMPTEADLHPNMRFVENEAVRMLREHPVLQEVIQASGVSWTEQENLVKKLYQKLVSTPEYQRYMTEEPHSFLSDVSLVRFILTDIFTTSEDLEVALEEQSIYWNDELEFILSVLYKLLDFIGRNEKARILEPKLFRNEDDRKYAFKLLHQSIFHFDEYKRLIEEKARNWDVDRIALMDTLIIVQGITELIHFPDIPVRVSINEYIDIAKFYSTPKSSVFVNGILDRIVSDLKQNERIKKSGRGLIGDEQYRG